MSSSIHTGFWRNWDPAAPAYGWTLTLPVQGGVIFVSFVTLLIAVAGAHLWSLMALTLHQLRSTTLPRDGLYHQEQVLLANTTSSSSAAWTLLIMLWKWRSSARRPVWRSSYLFIVAVAHFLGVSSAGIAISRWLRVENLVLGTGKKCGFVQPSWSFSQTLDSQQQNNAFYVWARRLSQDTMSYTRSCYAKKLPYEGACQSFQLASIPFSHRNVPCPFGSRLCALPTALEVDSGYLDSNTHFGINLPPEDKVSFRKIITCAPTLADQNFATNWTSERPLEGDSSVWGDVYKYYNLGRTAKANYSRSLSNYSERLSESDYVIR